MTIWWLNDWPTLLPVDVISKLSKPYQTSRIKKIKTYQGRKDYHYYGRIKNWIVTKNRGGILISLPYSFTTLTNDWSINWKDHIQVDDYTHAFSKRVWHLNTYSFVKKNRRLFYLMTEVYCSEQIFGDCCHWTLVGV